VHTHELLGGRSTGTLAMSKIRSGLSIACAVAVLLETRIAVPHDDVDASKPQCGLDSVDPISLFREGGQLVSPYMVLTDRPASTARNRESDRRTGIACLDRAIQLRADYWQALWVRGKAYRALRDFEAARDSFKAAFALQSENPDVGRELVAAYLELGDFGEAVPIAKTLSDSHPTNAGLRANYALALLLDGQIAAAEATVTDAIRLDPSDPITITLKSRIDDVERGRRRRPISLHDLER